MVAVKFDDLSSAFDFVSYAAPMEHQAYISLDTGKIYWISDAIDTIEEAIPEDLEDPDRYLAIPHKNELDLGSSLALRFAAQQLPARYDQIEGFSSREGDTRASRIYSSAKVLWNAGMRLKPTLSKRH
ncbi:hypothetical protein OKW38_000574 [Paraburkholderia sp. MM5496-R1]|uniref:hypothetical protein n=1 Tax=Paraburkholderia sp. MM5496-R1 TaxID=2991065 RepID=UPI003D20EBB2